MDWGDLQTSVAQALKQPEAAIPKGVQTLAGGVIPKKRFNVYRNNVAVSLINVLMETFPTVCDLVGEDFFRTMARLYSQENLPKTPMMHLYGEELPEFIETYEHTLDVPFLPDVARLEWQRNEAYYSTDAEPIKIDDLAKYTEEEIPELRFELHPSLKLLNSDWPVVSIWQAHQQENTKEQLKNLTDEGEAALVIRPHLDVDLRKIAPATFIFIKALKKGDNFAAAVENAVKNDEAFEIPANLAGLFSTGAVTAVHLKK